MPPKFPPAINEWLPAEPLSPPLPKWLAHSLGLNPWLTPEQFTQLAEETSDWAARRAEAMIGPTYGFEAVRRAAHNMVNSYISRLPPLPGKVAKPPGVRVPRERKPRVGKKATIEGLEEALRPTGLTPEQEEKLTDATLELIIDYRKRHKGAAPPTEWKQEQAMAVVAWADDDYRVKISEARGLEIVQKALGMYAQVRD